MNRFFKRKAITPTSIPTPIPTPDVTFNYVCWFRAGYTVDEDWGKNVLHLKESAMQAFITRLTEDAFVPPLALDIPTKPFTEQPPVSVFHKVY